MCRRFIAPIVMFAAVTMLSLAPQIAAAQGQLPEPPVGFKPPPPPPPKPYQPVAATPPGPFNDPSFADFRNRLGTAAQHKDRAAVAKLIVPQGFFWLQDKDLADSGKSGIDNLAKAIGLDNPDGAGWEVLSDAASDPTLAELPQNKGLFCAPGPPTLDTQAFAKLVQDTGTDPAEWGYPTQSGTEVRTTAQPNAPVVEKLGMYLLRVLPERAPSDSSAPPSLHVALPDGKSGYVPVGAIAPLASDEICYTKSAGGWKIAGYVGGAPQ
jgi:hypothetical protein